MVFLGFTDPYNLAFDDVNANNNTLKNESQATANILVSGETYNINTTSSSSAKLENIVQKASIGKNIRDQSSTALGSTVRWNISVNLNGLAKATPFTNPVIVELLPQGLDFKSVYINEVFFRETAKITPVDNYQNSGRQAIVIELRDFRVRDLPSSGFSAVIHTEINENAASTWNENAPEENMNYFYFYSDEWKDLDPNVIYERTGGALLDDIFDADRDGIKDEKIFGGRNTFVASLPEEVQGLKYIREQEGDPWGNDAMYLGYNTDFQYKLTVRNNDSTPLSNLYVYDKFPYEGDTEYYYLEGAYPSRRSAFSTIITGPIINPDPEKYTVMYRLDKYPPSNPQSAIADTDLWKTEAEVPAFGGWQSVTAIYVKMNEGYELDAYSEVDFIVNAKTPEYIRANPYNRAYANNNFAVSYNGINYGQSNTVAVRLTLDLPVEKQWIGGNESSRRPITVQLLLNGEVPPAGWNYQQTLELNEANEWKGVFEGIPAIGPLGEEFKYTVREETEVLGYTSEVTGDDTNGFVIKNSYQPEVFPIKIDKIWQGGEYYNNGNRPDVIVVVTPYLNGVKLEEGRAITISGNNQDGWTSTTLLPNTDAEGNEIEYRVTEPIPPQNYEFVGVEITNEQRDEMNKRTSISFEVTNKFVSPLKHQEFSKFWYGGSHPRPEATFQIFRHLVGTTWETSEAYTDAVSSATTPNKPYLTMEVPEFDEKGRPYRYVVTEIGGLEDYVIYRDTTDTNTIAEDLINTYVSPRKDITGEKIWSGGPDNPPEVSLQLMRNGVKYEPGFIIEGSGVPGSIINLTFPGYDDNFIAKVQPDGNWKMELPLGLDPTEVRFEIKQYKTPDKEVPRNDPSNILVQSSPIFYLFNGNEPEIQFSIDKVLASSRVINGWGIPGESVRVELDGKDYTATVGTDRRWTIEIPEGVEIKTDSDLNGYHEDMFSDPFIMINPNLQMDDPDVDSAHLPVNPIIISGDNTTAKWNVDVNDFYAQKYNYSIIETEVPEGYAVKYESDEEGNTIISNTFGAKVSDIPVHKDWVGDEGPYPKITFELQRRIGDADFEKVEDIVLDSGDHIHIFKDMPLTDDKDQKYEYQVIETFIGDTEVINDEALIYKVSHEGSVTEGFTVTNTSNNTASIDIKKIWVDNNNEEDKRPNKIVFTVTREDGIEKTQIFDVDKIANEKTYTISGLQKYKANSTEEYKYTVDEFDVIGYEKKIEGNASNGFEITNTLREKGSFIGSLALKVDAITLDPLSGAKFQLLDFNTKEIVVSDIITDTNGIIKVDNLQEGMYLLSEVEPPIGYVRNISEFTVIVNQNGNISINGTNVVVENDTPNYRIVNVPEDFALVVQLTDQNKILLPGGEFELWKEGEDQPYGNYTTDQNGLIILEKLASGNYRLKQIRTLDGYEMETEEISFTIPDEPNSRIVDIHVINPKLGDDGEKIQITVNKIWRDVPRGSSVPDTTVFVLGSDMRYQEQKLVSGMNSVTFLELDKYDKDGNEITYRIVEDVVRGYYPEITGNMHTGFTVTNTGIPEPGNCPDFPICPECPDCPELPICPDCPDNPAPPPYEPPYFPPIMPTPNPEPIPGPTVIPTPEPIPLPVVPTPQEPVAPPAEESPMPIEEEPKEPTNPIKKPDPVKTDIPKTDDPLVFWLGAVGILGATLIGIIYKKYKSTK